MSTETPLPTEADLASMDSTGRNNARKRFQRRGLPVPVWLQPLGQPLDEVGLGVSDSKLRHDRLARWKARGYPKRTTCLGCGRSMVSESPSHRIHTRCRAEAHPGVIEHRGL